MAPEMALLHTAKFSLTGKKVDEVATICKCWQRFAEDLGKDAAHCGIDAKKRELCDSFHVLKSISHNCQNIALSKDHNTICYLAYAPKTKKLLGIATGTFWPHSFHLSALAANPKNIAESKGKKITHVGTALILHICHDMRRQLSKKESELMLWSLKSTRGFYQKLGFTGSQDPAALKMTLSCRNRKQLIQKYRDNFIRDVCPIPLSNLLY
jgi:hypothetical protein